MYEFIGFLGSKELTIHTARMAIFSLIAGYHGNLKKKMTPYSKTWNLYTVAIYQKLVCFQVSSKDHSCDLYYWCLYL